VLGGGIGGLTAAHELAERGFAVTVYERRAVGGKARSFGVPGSARGGRRPLPAEHGARFIPGLYQNLPDTMQRIPFGRNGSTFDNLVTATQESYARDRGRSDWVVSLAPHRLHPFTLEQWRQFLVATVELMTQLPPHQAAYFAERLLVFFTSCDARRFGQWEQMSWWDFVAAERFSDDYRKQMVSSVTRFLLGSKADEACARTLGVLWEASLYNFMGRGSNGDFDRVLNLPTNEALIDPWVAELERLGVHFQRGEVERLALRRGRASGALVRGRRGRELVEADWFVCAIPVERARRLFDRRVLAADPSLERLRSLRVAWQNGLQLYLREPTPIVHGHVLYLDSPWALSSISQAQFWPSRDFANDYGDGSAHECLSVDISNFDDPGVVYGKAARELSAPRIVRDTWEQMKAHLNDTGEPVLRDDQVVSWKLDPGLVRRRGRMHNDDPLFISTRGVWADRPQAATAIPNLFLAADYVQVNIDTATMDGANEAGRRATNAILDAAGSSAQPAAVRDLYRPPELEPFRRADEELWRQGRPNALDVPPPPGSLAGILSRD
jgi:uncharacterized protein with NAD-binding domain and iron-sulfur cluster